MMSEVSLNIKILCFCDDIFKLTQSSERPLFIGILK